MKERDRAMKKNKLRKFILNRVIRKSPLDEVRRNLEEFWGNPKGLSGGRALCVQQVPRH